MRRRCRRRRHVIVGAAVLVEGDYQQRVPGIGAVGGHPGPDRVVDLGEQCFAAEQRRRRIDRRCQGRARRTRMHVVVAVQQVGLDERVRRQRAVGRVLQELIGGDEPGAEVGPQARRVNDARQRHMARRIAVDAPAQPRLVEALEDRLGSVVQREGGHRGQVVDVARRTPRMKERAVRERLRRDLAEPVIVALRTRGPAPR